MEKKQNIDDNISHITPIDTLYKNWFLDYASYVILERAIPLGLDGLKPVQRRILFAMKEMDDNRYHKVANIIGQTMQYHPHGDAGISDALVNLGQKNLLIDTQGNWGDFRTGDRAAASRYIEARLNAFAKEVLFNHKTTDWQLSYDGRKKEPIALPAKFPLLLFHGTDGIAVGLSTKILPHNFIELLEASIAYLKGKEVTLYPDFQTGASMDVSDYNKGKKGGRIISRAKINIVSNKLLIVKELPYGVTSSQLCDSIIKAHENNKIKIKKVTDNTAKEVEIEIETNGEIHSQMMKEALYVFTECETKTSVNACVIIDNKPQFLTVNDLLIHSVENTKNLLAKELSIEIEELKENILYSSLEKIFIEEKIYRDIEEAKSWQEVLDFIDKGISPYKKKFYRNINQEDIIKLTEIKIKKISKYDTKLTDEKIKDYTNALKNAKDNFANITNYTICHYENILDKYSKGKERKTLLESYDNIEVKSIAVVNTKIYVDRKEGFIGTSLKKEDFLLECSDVDEIIAFISNGSFKVVKVQDKAFVGKGIIHANVFKKNDTRTTYNYIYANDKNGVTYAKRFQIQGITRDRSYPLCGFSSTPKILYFSEMPNGETEVVRVLLSPNSKARIKDFLFDFNQLFIKNRSSVGNQITKYAVRKISRENIGTSSLGNFDTYYNAIDGRLTNEKIEGAINLGNLAIGDKLVAFYHDGYYEMFDYDGNIKFDHIKTILVSKHNDEKVYSMIYYDNNSNAYYVKRFVLETLTTNIPFSLIKSEKERIVAFISDDKKPVVEYSYTKKGKKYLKEIILKDFVSVKNQKALGNKLIDVKRVNFNPKPVFFEKT